MSFVKHHLIAKLYNCRSIVSNSNTLKMASSHLMIIVTQFDDGCFTTARPMPWNCLPYIIDNWTSPSDNSNDH